MTESKAGGVAGKIVFVGIGVIVVGIGGLILLLVIIGAIAGGSEGGRAGVKAVCTPGNSRDAGIEVPTEYEDHVSAAAAESGFSAEVIAAQIQHESSWNPEATSPVGAQGIAQFMPATWDSFGEGGNVLDPADAIAAQGRYMGYLRDFMEDHAESEEHLLELTLAGYNAGEGAVQRNSFDLPTLYASGPGYDNETRPYVANIKAAAEGNYSSNCEHGGSAPSGDITEAAGHFAWDEKVVLNHSSAANHGREAAKDEFVVAADGINSDRHTAYYTDCGVFVATVMLTANIDPSFPSRGTSQQLPYLRSSDDYEFFSPQSEGELKSGDILITPGHIYIYTGERHSGADGRALGASLYTRPPSGHDFYLTDTSNRSYYAARYVG
ncbi:transglycosylase SLT domain-containing protein [Micrococcaceae sp. AOP34-BR2-30]